MVFLSYEHITNKLDDNIKTFVKKIKVEGINITQDYSKLENADCIIIVIENIRQYIKSDKSVSREFDFVMQKIEKQAECCVFITFENITDYRDLIYVKKNEVFFLNDDWCGLIRKLKKIEKPRKKKEYNFIKAIKFLISVGGLTVMIGIGTIVSNFILKGADIDSPHFEIKWRYLSAYQYTYISSLDGLKVDKKVKPVMKDLISRNMYDNIVVGVIVLRNIGDEFPDNTVVHMERIQKGQIFEESMELKTIAHKNYIMIPVFVTEAFSEDTDLLSLTKEEIWNHIDYELVFRPTSLSYDKPRFWSWQKEEEVKIEDSSDALSEISIKLEEPSAEVDEPSDNKSKQLPHINKYKILGQ